MTAPEILKVTKQAIKQDLFRFATLRAPEQLNEEMSQILFVTHPDPSQSQFLSCPDIGPGEPFTMAPVQTYLETEYSLADKSFQKHAKLLDADFETLYDFSIFVSKRKGTVSQLPQLETDFVRTIPYPLSSAQKYLLFDLLMFEITFNTSTYRRQAVSQILIIEHALNQQTELPGLGINKIQDIKVEIPVSLISHVNAWRYNLCGGNGTHGVRNLGIIDFKKVEQLVCTYMPGEVSHIENIMAKEYKEKSTRNYVRSENTIETSRESEVENLSDVTTATRSQLSTEIAQVLEQDRSFSVGASASMRGETNFLIAKADLTAGLTTDFAMNNSSSISNTQAQEYAQDVTRRALERIVQKTSERRTSKIIKEFEENIKHGFDNRGGESNITGIYRWIDIVYKNRLVNYGKRLAIEFSIPEPAKWYKRAMKMDMSKAEETETSSENLPPQSLEDRLIMTHEDITLDNYMDHAAYYGATVNEPLPIQISKTQAFLGAGHDNSFSTPFVFPIDLGYEAHSFHGNATYRYKGRRNNHAHFNMAFTAVSVPVNWSGYDGGGGDAHGEQSFQRNFNTPQSNSFTITVSGDRLVGPINFQITALLKLPQTAIDAWKLEVYQLLQSAYEAKLAAYEMEQERVAELSGSDEEDQFSNPALNRITEQRELKRAALELITKPFCRSQGYDFFTEESVCEDKYEIPQINQTPALTSYMNQVRFLEHAFDWAKMSYEFQPYYWASKCDWVDLMQSKSDDLLFQAFLQSGAATLLVPVKPGMEASVSLYLRTGDIWTGGDLIPGTEDNLFTAAINDVSSPELPTGETLIELAIMFANTPTWETRVPTTLAIIQNKSAYLENEGLPYCETYIANEGEEDEETRPISDILTSEETLTRLPDAE